MVERQYGILSDQVEDKVSANMLVQSQKVQHLAYFEFVNENFRLVGSGSELNYPETDFAQSNFFFIASSHIYTANSLCSMHISTVRPHSYNFIVAQKEFPRNTRSGCLTTTRFTVARAALVTVFVTQNPTHRNLRRPSPYYRLLTAKRQLAPGFS